MAQSGREGVFNERGIYTGVAGRRDGEGALEAENPPKLERTGRNVEDAIQQEL